MSLYHLSNEYLSVSISDKGAELQSIVHNGTGFEYMWSGNPDYWAKKSPVLFPIVGGLKNNTYHYSGNDYVLGRHGFARDRVFTVINQSAESILFELTSDAESLLVYPFQFVFQIGYQLTKNSIKVNYLIKNTDTKKLYFSVGAHPAFAVPFAKDTVFEDYYLQFSQPEHTGIWPLSPEGLIKEESVPFLKNEDKISLQKSLFYGDALVFTSLQSNTISILCHKHAHGIKVSYQQFPYMGIWSAKNADFVCIEPWCGIADHVNATGKIEEKEGIHSLNTGEEFNRNWSVTVF
jgi:galactose mutarotase-like enzyme